MSVVAIVLPVLVLLFLLGLILFTVWVVRRLWLRRRERQVARPGFQV
jgi:flagellar biogenesis protein FliO